MKEAANLVILVHGTFASKAEWLQKDSSLINHLCNNTNSSLCVFPWSGKNSNKERLNSAKELAAEIDDIHRRKPSRKISIIAHSHGGNIALYCHKYLNDKKAIHKIVCMGTPFFSFEVSGVKNTLWLILSFLPFVGFIILNSGFHYSTENPISTNQFTWFIIFLLLLFLAQKILSRYIESVLINRIDDLKYSDVIQSHILNLRYKFDEASIGLKLFDSISEVPIKIYNLLSKWLIYAIIIFALDTYIMQKYNGITINENNWKIALLVITSYFISVLVIVPSLFLLIVKFIYWPLALLFDALKFSPAAIGWENPLISLFADVSVHSDFPIVNNKLSVQDEVLDIKTNYFKRQLNHSKYYIDPISLKKISDFINW